MVYGGLNAKELSRSNSETRRNIRALNQAGRAYYFTDEEVCTEEENVINLAVMTSNDPHIIALARVSGARTLCSHDIQLHRDFRNRNLINRPRGHIYQNSSHRHLLDHTGSCPSLI
jgi:hypothetical protein